MISEPLAALWAIECLPELGPGKPNESVRAALKALTPETAFPNLRNREAALACISGTWLYHDFLDESHTISQDLDDWFGSYWHGIMHRREPDADNAKYWFRRVPANPIFEELGTPSTWNPANFIDRCERSRDKGTEEETRCRELQLKEMRLLFEWCCREAGGV